MTGEYIDLISKRLVNHPNDIDHHHHREKVIQAILVRELQRQHHPRAHRLVLRFLIAPHHEKGITHITEAQHFENQKDPLSEVHG